MLADLISVAWNGRQIKIGRNDQGFCRAVSSSDVDLCSGPQLQVKRTVRPVKLILEPVRVRIDDKSGGNGSDHARVSDRSNQLQRESIQSRSAAPVALNKCRRSHKTFSGAFDRRPGERRE